MLICRWLQAITLGRYTALFEHHDIDGMALFELSDENLREMRVHSKDRALFKNEVAALKEQIAEMVRGWGCEDVLGWLCLVEEEEYVEVLQRKPMNGEMLVSLSENDLVTDWEMSRADQKRFLEIRNELFGHHSSDRTALTLLTTNQPSSTSALLSSSSTTQPTPSHTPLDWKASKVSSG